MTQDELDEMEQKLKPAFAYAAKHYNESMEWDHEKRSKLASTMAEIAQARVAIHNARDPQYVSASPVLKLAAPNKPPALQ